MTDPSSSGSTTVVADRYEPLLGTVVEVRIELEGSGREAEADALSESVAHEMLRLQSVLSSVDRASEFSRWCRGAVEQPSTELATVLELAARWRVCSDGRFDPAAGLLTDRWRRAEAEGVDPTDDELRALTEDIARPRWSIVEGSIVRHRDASDCTLNALAKGWIADRGAELAAAVDGLLLAAVNAGGDISVRGPDGLRVGIEDPTTPWDNATPLVVVRLRDAGLATSGSARRGFDIDGAHHSHVLDPRTGRPVDDAASITVVADDAATADVLATVLGVQPADDAIAEAEERGLPCLVVRSDGTRHTTDAWRDLVVS